MTDKQIIIYKKECYNEPYCSLNKVLEQLEAYKMEAEEGKEINAELKAEIEVLEKVNKTNQEKIKKLNEQVEEEFIAQQYGDMALFWKVEDYKQALTEIKEIAIEYQKEYIVNNGVILLCNQILQKCEVLDEN